MFAIVVATRAQRHPRHHRHNHHHRARCCHTAVLAQAKCQASGVHRDGGDAVLGVMPVPLYFRCGGRLKKKTATTVGQTWPSRRRGGLTHSGKSCDKKKPLPLARRKALPQATRGKHEATRGNHRAVQSRKGVARTATEVIAPAGAARGIRTGGASCRTLTKLGSKSVG